MRFWVLRTVRPFASLIAVAVSAWAFYRIGPVEIGRVELIAGTLATVAGTLFGLVLASASLLISAGDKRLIANMRITGHFKVLCRHMFWAAGLWGTVMLVALVAMLWEESTFRALVSVAAGLSVLALISIGWLLRRLAIVLYHLN